MLSTLPSRDGGYICDRLQLFVHAELVTGIQPKCFRHTIFEQLFCQNSFKGRGNWNSSGEHILLDMKWSTRRADVKEGGERDGGTEGA